MTEKILIILLAALVLAGSGAGAALAAYGDVNAEFAQSIGLSDDFILLDGWVNGLNEGAQTFRADADDISDKYPVFGYKNIAGEILVAPQFSEAGNFSDGLAYVAKEGLDWGGYIDTTGKYVIPPLFSAGDEFRDGKAIVSLNFNSMALINKKGEFLIPPDYKCITINSSLGKYICQKEDRTDLFNEEDLSLDKSFPYLIDELMIADGDIYMFFYDKDWNKGVLEYNTGKIIVPLGSHYIAYNNGVFLAYGYGANPSENKTTKVYALNGKLKASFETGRSEILFTIPLTTDRYYVYDQAKDENYIYEEGVKNDVDYYVAGQLAGNVFEISEKPAFSGEVAGLRGAMDQDGNIIIPIEYEYFIGNPQGKDPAGANANAGFKEIIAYNDMQISVFDQSGTLLHQFPGKPEAIYDSNQPFFAYCDPEGIYHILDKSFNPYFSLKCQNAYFYFYNDCTIVNIDGEDCTIINKNSDILKTPQYVSLDPVSVASPLVYPDDDKLYIKAGYNKMLHGDRLVLFDSRFVSSAPVIQSDRILLPPELLLNNFYGMSFDYYHTSYGIAASQALGKSLIFTVDSGTATLIYFDDDTNDYKAKEIALEAPARNIDGILYIPLRAAAEVLGLDVFWDDATKLAGVGTISAALSPQQAAEIAGEFDRGLASVEELRRLDASLATQPFLDYISARILGVDPDSIYGIANYSNTIPAYEALISGEKDLILVTGPSPDIQRQAAEKDVELEVIPFAKEGFVFLVNAANPVKSLTREQLQDIYQGKITNWREVGGPDLPIVAYQRNENSGSQTIMENDFMNGLKMVDPLTTRVDSMAGLIEVVAEFREDDNGGVGYSVYFYAREMVGNPRVDLIALDGIPPSSATIRDETYPVVVNYYAVKRRDDHSPATQKLLDFILSDEGQACVNESGLVSIR